MKQFIACLMLTAGLAGASLAQADPATSVPQARQAVATKILAIGALNSGVAPDQLNAVLPSEVRATVALYLDGKIDQWYSLGGDSRGVVFILNTADAGAAHDMLEKLPLGQAHMMSFELIPIGPLAPLKKLVDKPVKP